MKKFTDRYLKSLKPEVHTYTVTEKDGFSIRVYPSGEKSFYYIYKEDGKIRKLAIAPYPAVSLAEAKKKYDAMHSRRKQGLPPVEADGITLGELANEYITKYAKKKKATWEEDLRILDKDILPALGHDSPAKGVRRGEVSAMMGKMAPFAARNAFKVLRRLYNWAIGTDQYGLENSPCDRLSQPVPDTKKDRFLTPEEIRAFWHGILKTNMSRPVVCALRFILATGQRPSECCELEMREIDGEWWELPGTRTKNGKGHRVYLSPLAKEIIDVDAKRRYGFPSPDTKKPFPHTRLSQSLKRFRDAKDAKGKPLYWPFPDFTPHDLRRTCATYLAELEFPQEVIGAVLNHQAKDVTGIYNRYKYGKEKQAALLAWERRLREIIGQ